MNAPDDRRLLDRDAAGTQPPAPVARPTPPERLHSRPWAEVKRDKWYHDMARSPREVVARALRQVDADQYGDEGVIYLWSELPDENKEEYLRRADAALDAVAPLLRSPTFRSVEARRSAELRQALTLVEQLRGLHDDAVNDLLRLEAKLQRYRESVRALARIVQRKRAGANRQVAYYRRLYLNVTERLREERR